jgi:hypothetical protein
VQFQDLVVRSYNILRRHAPLLMALAMQIPTATCVLVFKKKNSQITALLSFGWRAKGLFFF